MRAAAVGGIATSRGRFSYWQPSTWSSLNFTGFHYNRGVFEIVRTGETPVVVKLTRLLGASLDDVRASLRRMHDAHVLVLQPTGEVLMANPFSAVPTPFLAEVGGRRWFGNCIWDALGIIATLYADGRVLASCGSSGERMELSVSDGVLAGQGIVHFGLPARRWWEDIVFN